MPRTRLKPIRMPELFPSNGTQDTSQSIQRSKRKFVPQRITEADLEEFSPAAKTRKVQESARGTSERRRRFTAVRMVLTDADVDDTPPNATAKKKGKKSTTKTARKELFSNEKKKTLRSNFRSTAFNKNTVPQKMAPSKKLDTTNPLIDINEAEAVLLKGAYVGFKKRIQESSVKKPKLTQTSLPRLSLQPSQIKRKVETRSKSPSPIISLPVAELSFENATSTVRKNPPKSLDVSTDSEFLEMERNAGVPSPQASLLTKTTMKFDTPDKENRNLSGKIASILQDVDWEFQSLKRHCDSFEKKLDESKRQIAELLKSSDSFDKRTESLTPLMPRLENLRVSTLKKVTFNLNHSPKRSVIRNRLTFEDEPFSGNSTNSSLNDASVNNTAAKNKGVERAIGLYNSMRKAYKSILSTPKFDRSTLETPTSNRRRKNSVSKKVQKQCLLLHDTPLK